MPIQGSSSSNDTLCQALKCLLAGNDGIRILDYGDTRVFEDLWLKGLQEECPEIAGIRFQWKQKSTVLLVGDPPLQARWLARQSF
jgi:hypothetical protein